MKKYDFLILYEHRNRELENAVLLAMLLERKGYSVSILYRRSAKLMCQKAEVLLVPFFYNDYTVEDFAIQPFHQFSKVINLQYEQVFLKENEKLGNSMPRGVARLAEHIAWGDVPFDLMKNNDIDEARIHKIGHISMDLNQPKYNEVFYSKTKLAKKFNIPIEKKWHLFISSFSCVGISDEELKQWETTTAGIYDFTKKSYESFEQIIDWFDKILAQTDDYIIYRPHPHEVDNIKLRRLESKYKNFVCNSSYSIRQWIRVCDSIYTWCSTSIVDVYYANKKCAIIRPIPFSSDLEYRLYDDQKKIDNYQEFENVFFDNRLISPINETTIRKYYCNDRQSDTFSKLVNVAIEVYKENKEVDYKKITNYSLFRVIKRSVYNIFMSLAGYMDYSKIVPDKYSADVLHAYKEQYRYKEEIKFHRRRFERILNK